MVSPPTQHRCFTLWISNERKYRPRETISSTFNSYWDTSVNNPVRANAKAIVFFILDRYFRIEILSNWRIRNENSIDLLHLTCQYFLFFFTTFNIRDLILFHWPDFIHIENKNAVLDRGGGEGEWFGVKETSWQFMQRCVICETVLLVKGSRPVIDLWKTCVVSR